MFHHRGVSRDDGTLDIERRIGQVSISSQAVDGNGEIRQQMEQIDISVPLNWLNGLAKVVLSFFFTFINKKTLFLVRLLVDHAVVSG